MNTVPREILGEIGEFLPRTEIGLAGASREMREVLYPTRIYHIKSIQEKLPESIASGLIMITNPDIALKFIQKFPRRNFNFFYLNLSKCNIDEIGYSDEGAYMIRNYKKITICPLVNVETLDLSNNSIEIMNGIWNVKKLIISYNQRLVSIGQLISDAENLEEIEISSCNSLIYVDKLEECKKLQKVILKGNLELQTTDGLLGVPNVIVDTCSRVFDVSSLRESTNVVLKNLYSLNEIDSLGNVDSLFIFRCLGIADFSNLRNNRILSIISCNPEEGLNLSDFEHTQALLISSTNVQNFEISNEVQILHLERVDVTNEDLRYFGNVKVLSLSNVDVDDFSSLQCEQLYVDDVNMVPEEIRERILVTDKLFDFNSYVKKL